MKKLPWRTTKAIGVGLRDNKATDKVVNAALSNGLGRALRAVSPKAFGKLADRNIERAKTRSSTLWRRPFESKESYEGRQNEIVKDAHVAQLRSLGMKEGVHYEIKDGKVKTDKTRDAYDKRIKELKRETGVRLYGRKDAHDYIDKVGNVYQTEDIIANKINPKIIAKWSKCLGNDGNDLYSIPEFSI